jgi:hypothetical protein
VAQEQRREAANLERFSGWCRGIGVVRFQVPPVPSPAVLGAREIPPVRAREGTGGT